MSRRHSIAHPSDAESIYMTDPSITTRVQVWVQLLDREQRRLQLVLLPVPLFTVGTPPDPSLAPIVALEEAC